MNKTSMRYVLLGLSCVSSMATSYAAEQPAAVPASAPTAIPASAPAAEATPAPTPVAAPAGSLTVQYSTKLMDGSYLKAKPTEVGIITRSETVTAAVGKVAVAFLTLAGGGGASFSGFGKDDLAGTPIAGVQERGNLQNPVPEVFVENLQRAVNEFLAKDAKLRDTTFKKPLIVAGGSARLVYETLTGNDEEQYRLKAYVMVYKAKERWSMMPNMPVYCALQSPQPLLLSDWAVDNFIGVKARFDEMLASCQDKVLEALPVMLKS